MIWRCSRCPSFRRLLLTFLGGVFLVFVWYVLSRIYAGKLVLPSPFETLSALFGLLTSGIGWQTFGITLLRVGAAIFAGGAVGLLLGIAAGLSRDLRWFLEPLRWVSMSIPPITVVVIAMLWLGVGSGLVVCFASVMLAPIVYVNTIKGFDLVDDRLLEMATLYRFSLSMRVRRVYIPALTVPLSAAAVQVVCNAVRVTLLAEVIGSNNGMGAAISLANSTLELPTLFAWILIAVLLVGLLESLLLGPMQRRSEKWSKAK